MPRFQAPRLRRITRRPSVQFVAAGLIITAVSYLLVRAVLDLDASLVPEHREFEPNAGLISTAYNAIRHSGEFPLWNPYVATGVPYLGDPAVYLFNPLGSVPGLILGPVNGPKIGILLAVMFSGFSGYYFASVLGLSWPARVWAGVALAINGHLGARIFGGQFQMAIAFPFIAFSIALFIQSLRRPGAHYPILAGASIALLLFSGLLYNFLYTIGGLAVIFLFYAAAGQAHGWDRASIARLTKRAVQVAAWAAGFAAASLIPFAQTADFVGKDADTLLMHSQTMPNSFLNFLVSDPEYYRTDNRGMPGGFLSEFYSFVGLVPVVSLPLLIPAFRRGNRLLIGLLAALFVFYLAWSSAAHTPFQYLYDLFPFLFNFRWTSRALAPATVILIILAAIGIDELLALLTSSTRPRILPRRRLEWLLQPKVLLALTVVLLAAIAYDMSQVFSTNRSLFALAPRRTDRVSVGRWFEENDVPPGYISWIGGAGPGIVLGLAERGVLRLDPVYWRPKLDYQVDGDPPPADQIINPRAEYLVLPGDVWPQEDDARLTAIVPGAYIYRLEDSPPFASVVASADPPVGTEVPWGDKAVRAEARILSPNVIEVEATSAGPDQDRVLLLQSYFPGWRVEVDGARVGPADNLLGFVSTEALPGRHVYRFVFDPKSHHYGLAISLGTVLGAMLVGLSASNVFSAPLRRVRASVRSLTPKRREPP